jgi:phage terminase large subunit GpA-like protein
MNALYSPVGMLTFREIAEQREKKEAGGPEEMRSWINIYAGLPYKDTASRPRLAAVLNHRGACARGTVPPGALFLTAAVDVQEGSWRDAAKPPRLEIMIMAHGEGYRNWVVEYRVFGGSIDDPSTGAWEDMDEWLNAINATFFAADGFAYPIQMLFVDSGDGAPTRTDPGTSYTDIVYRYCELHAPLAFPIKGFASLKPRRGESPDADIPGAASYKKYRLTYLGGGAESIVEISTAKYKAALFTRLKTEATAENLSPAGYFEVFREAADDFFIQLTNSEYSPHTKSFRDIGDHEVLDTAIYNLCAGDCFLDNQVMRFKSERRAAGMDPMAIEMTTNKKFVLSYLRQAIDSWRGKKKPPPY